MPHPTVESMKLIPEAAFLEWAAGQEVGIDERYSDPRYLVHRPYRDFTRFWQCADDVANTEKAGRRPSGRNETVVVPSRLAERQALASPDNADL
jgi:hypothetical protein